MKKLIKTVFIILLVFAVLIAAAVASARVMFPEEFKFAVTTLKQFGVAETVKLAYDFVTGNTLDEKTFNDNKTENDKQLQGSINEHGYSVTDEQLEQMNSGKLSEDEIADILMGNVKPDVNEDVPTQDSSAIDSKQEDRVVTDNPEPDDNVKVPDSQDKVSQDEKPQQNTQQNKVEKVENNATNTQDPRIAKLIAKMYVLKSRYTSDIESIIASMKAEYVTYPAQERTTSLKASIATKYMNSINAMEAQCDAQVEVIVAEIRTILKQTGSDESLADSILSAYNSEKSSTKSYYIGKYAD